MTTSAPFSTDNQYIKYSIDVTQNWQDIAGNYSRVTIRVYFWRTNTGYNTYGTGKCWVRFDGTWYGQDITPSQKINEYGIYLFERSFDIYHNSDGTRDLYVEAYIYHERVESLVQGFTVSLDDIGRASKVSSITGDYCGDTMTVTLNRSSSSFSHSIWLRAPGGTWYQTANKSTNNPVSFTIPHDIMYDIPSATSCNLEVCVRTYNGSSQIGSDQYSSKWMGTPSWVVPSISQVRVDTDHQINGGWLHVKDKSKMRVRTTAAGTYGSWITDYKIEYDGTAYWGSDIYTNTLRNSGTRTIKVTVWDSRGRTASWSGTASVQDYYVPWGNIKAYRCNESGMQDDVNGTYVKVEFSGGYSSVAGYNAFALAIDHRESGGVWSANDYWTDSPTGGSSVILGAPGNAYDVDKMYEIRLKVSDWYTTSYFTMPINTASVLIDFKAGGKGIGFGRLATSDNYAQFNMGITMFAGVGGEDWKGADLYMENVSQEGATIGIIGGAPQDDHFLSLYMPQETSQVRNGKHWYWLTNGDSLSNFARNMFKESIYFTDRSGYERQIRAENNPSYLYFTSNLGCWNENSSGGLVWRTNSSGQLALQTGYTTESDERIKNSFDEFTDWDDFYNFYMSLKPKTYKLNDDLKDRRFIGLVAQEVADSIVDNNLMNSNLALVRCEENDAMDDGRQYHLAYQELISLNIKMIQMHDREIQELNDVIFKQQESIEQLKEMVEVLINQGGE